MADYYELLEIDPDADSPLIRAAWMKRSRELHPDALGRRGATAETMKEAERLLADVNRAYAVLSDPAARRTYDESNRTVLERQHRWKAAGAARDGVGPKAPAFDVTSVSLSNVDSSRPVIFRIDVRQVAGGRCRITDLHLVPQAPWTTAMFRRYSFIDDNRQPPVTVEFELDASELGSDQLRVGDIELIVDTEDVDG